MREKCVCVRVFVLKEKRKPKRGTRGKSQHEEEKQLLLMTYIEGSLSGDITRIVSQPEKSFEYLCTCVGYRMFIGHM